MMTFVSKLAKLNKLLQLHTSWLLFFVFGKTAISATSFDSLKAYKKLPLDSSLNLAETAFTLGKLKATLKQSEYTALDLQDTEDLLISADTKAVDQLSLKSILNITQFSTELTQLVSSLFSRLLLDGKHIRPELLSSLKVKFVQVIKTEMHRAKVAGSVHAIVTKQGIYAASNGKDSNVVVIPGENCCLDCTNLYLVGGVPKVFVLSDLLNARQVNEHSKKAGIHTHWVPTLPPVHPSCGCMVRYVPPGYAWENGKLSLVNKSLFDSSLVKATAGVSGGISATVKPKGPPGQQKPPGTPSVAGVAAPGNVAGPGRPKTTGGGLAKTKPGPAAGAGPDAFVNCDFGGGEECRKHGGNGAAQHKANGSIVKKHREALADGATPQTEEGKENQKKQEQARAKAFFADKSQTVKTLADHLSDGNITSAKKLGSEGEHQSGTHISYKVTIAGNGAGCMKPPPSFGDEHYNGMNVSYADGLAGVPRNTGHISERGAYHAAAALGMEHVPVTVVRGHDGSSGVGHVGQMSVQSWQEGHNTLMGSGKPHSNLTDILSNVPDEHKAKIESKLSEIACLDIVMNNNDRHMGNLVFSEDTSDVKAIDHGFCFSAGMESHKNGIQHAFHRSGKDLKVPSHMMTRMKNQSFDQTKRQFAGSGLSDLQVAQTHLRMKYLAHLQDTHGHVPVAATRYALTRMTPEEDFIRPVSESLGARYLTPYSPGWSRDGKEREKEVDAAHKNWEMPDQQFAKFAKAYVTGAIASDLTDSDKEYMLKNKPVIPTGTGHFGGGTKRELDEHWDSIPDYKPIIVKDYDKAVDPHAPTRVPTNIQKQEQVAEAAPQVESSYIPTAKPAWKSLVLTDVNTPFPLDFNGKE